MKGWKQKDIDRLGSKVRSLSSIDQKKEKRYKAGWVEIGGKRFYARSKWEANYGRYLQWQKENGLIVDWHHEPDEFWFPMYDRGVRSYLPDFKVEIRPKVFEYHEVKGYMDSKSKTKINRFRKHYPKETLKVITSDWFKNNKSISKLIPGWN